ncbi:bifunctional 4-hydroxy-2-oxoglutarate aldolase/2-dehydro-3-deoxy-phosphogluconate aldolase [Helicobacter labacensis]|uniref:bifunctional 4-hydroxy-2-oxoglutarate aldolase/2-dehydro-3-deoxy-phosphogluconate aldolase n=1 Tax=Helicobacter labacensis TaxID=2316079 RepID=UPI000EABA6EE|nr:bifunctional 4-hydroxy-2-oxoglutarate aldolase/2-dehydro-3-deoxy-phosphogluconate aldolase [Helicobacter labacensis]
MQAQEVLNCGKIIPVITLQDPKWGVPLAKALLKGGIKILEITLRTAGALEGIALIAKEVPEAIVGAGTILNAFMLEQAKKAGARFAISPGINAKFAKEVQGADIALIPGVASAGELMLALEYGFEALKLFPAEAVGGVKLLKSFSAPFKGVQFCPTGGISLENMGAYLALENVSCVGGSWLTPQDLMAKGQWDQITQIAKQSVAQASLL